MSRLDSIRSDLIPDQTTQGRRAGTRMRREWRRVVVVYTLFVCAPLFFAYSQFRAHGGDAFSTVVRSLQGTYGVGRSTWFSTEWRETIVNTADEYAQVHLQLEYGRGPVGSVITPDGYPRHTTTGEGRNATLHIDVDTRLSQSEFSQLYPTFVSGLVNQFKAPPRVSLIEALRARMELLPWYAIEHAHFPGMVDIAPLGVNCTLAAILGAPGLPILAMLVLIPPWMTLPAFWLWVVLSIVYVVLPPRAWGWMRAAVVRSRQRTEIGTPKQ